MRHEDHKDFRAHIEKARAEGKKEKKTLDNMKISAGNLWKFGNSNRLAGEVLEQQLQATAIKKEQK